MTEKILNDEGRWDIDYHLPAVEINKFPKEIMVPMKDCVDFMTEKRDPTKEPDQLFFYVDIACIDVTTGQIVNPQELLGEEAPSRARKVIHEGDILVSTCRPTRGAIAIVPKELDNQICSTAFMVLKAKEGKSNEYLHFILRSALVKEQFRKFSTGSSYPAILDSDIQKTRIPLPDETQQNQIAMKVIYDTETRNKKIEETNIQWNQKLESYLEEIQGM